MATIRLTCPDCQNIELPHTAVTVLTDLEAIAACCPLCQRAILRRCSTGTRDLVTATGATTRTTTDPITEPGWLAAWLTQLIDLTSPDE